MHFSAGKQERLPAAHAGTCDPALSEGHGKTSVPAVQHHACQSLPLLSSDLSISYAARSYGRATLATVPGHGLESRYYRDR
jgi:hypothetical protein